MRGLDNTRPLCFAERVCWNAQDNFPARGYVRSRDRKVSPESFLVCVGLRGNKCSRVSIFD